VIGFSTLQISSEPAHAPDVALSLGHADGAARVEHVELMRCFNDEVIGRKHELVFGRGW